MGDDTVTSVSTVLAIQALTVAKPWSAASVRDIRMFKIEEDNDLAPAIAAVAPTPEPAPA